MESMIQALLQMAPMVLLFSVVAIIPFAIVIALYFVVRLLALGTFVGGYDDSLATQRATVSSQAFPVSHDKTGDEFRLRFAGVYASGNPHSADNDQIDADLALEYCATHEDEHAA